MLGTLLGQYRVLSELGSGGMGVVYLAVSEGRTSDLEVGRKVAVKVIRPELLEQPDFVERFRREVEIGRRIRHVNVVTTYGMGTAEQDGRTILYLSMEYVEGQTLRGLLESFGPIPESLLREIARQLAAGLSAIHEAGIVHCDLKPENVLLTKEHQVRIMDLGISRLLDEVCLMTMPGYFAGSLLYAAPEQFHPDGVGRATDLYALGVLLYESATGENPFRRSDAGAVIRAHLEEDPPSVSVGAPDLSPFMVELISALLEKDPAARPPSAAFLQDLLRLGERSPWWSRRHRMLLHARQHMPRIPVYHEAKLRGRSRELRVLRSAWKRARRGHGSVVLLEGEDGIGKTRLLDAFFGELAQSDAHVLYGAYPPAGGRGGLAEAILEHFGEAHLEQALKPYLRRARAQIPMFASIVKHVLPPQGFAPILRDGLHALTVELMAGMAEQKPVIWVLDDLHLAGPDSQEIVISMAEAVRDEPMLLVLTTRPEQSNEVASRLERNDNFLRCSLRRLSARNVIALLADVLHSQRLAAKLGDHIARRSDGVPLFVLEMAHGLRDGHFIQQRADKSYILKRPLEELDVPTAVRDLIEGRLEHLTEEERAILDVGAVQGDTFDAELVAGVLDIEPFAVLESLAAIERRLGLVRAVGGRTRFDHHQMQEVLYRALEGALRLEYHADLADAYAAREGIDLNHAATEGVSGEDAVFLATHHFKGLRPRAALPFLDGALDHLEASYRNRALVELIDRAMRVPGLLEIWRRASLRRRKIERLGYLADSTGGLSAKT